MLLSCNLSGSRRSQSLCLQTEVIKYFPKGKRQRALRLVCLLCLGLIKVFGQTPSRSTNLKTARQEATTPKKHSSTKTT
jgi:hypothetical protein